MAFPLHLNQIALAAGAAAAMTTIVLLAKNRKRVSEDERERDRRELLTREGRIIDGTLLGIDDPEGERPRSEYGPQALYYTYEISGVVYESSQDVAALRDQVHIEDCRLASPVSVRYDPRNHANSIIVAESWSGLRKGYVRRRPRSTAPSTAHAAPQGRTS